MPYKDHNEGLEYNKKYREKYRKQRNHANSRIYYKNKNKYPWLNKAKRQRVLELHPDFDATNYDARVKRNPNHNKEIYIKYRERRIKASRQYYYENRDIVLQKARLYYLRKKIFNTLKRRKKLNAK